MATTGVVGGSWRAEVTPGGTLVPWDGSAELAWYVAADDRWHDPATDTGVRQTRVDGTAVYETKVRIPGGDAVQRIWSVADLGGITLIEITNDSPMAIACAFTRNDLLTSRPATDVPVQGIDLPPGSIVVPIGHRTSVTVGLPHVRTAHADRTLPGDVPAADAVARGWIAQTDAASRLELPDTALVHLVRAARVELLLGARPGIGGDPADFLLGVGELVRLRELDASALDALIPEVAGAAERLARSDAPLRDAAFDAAAVAFHAAGERRAVRDLARIRSGLTPSAALSLPSGDEVAAIDPDVTVVARTERQLASGPVLVPWGLAGSWLGQPIEAHGLVTGPASTVSIGMRWHGPNVAVLWEQVGEPLTLSSGLDEHWSTQAVSGEGLWVMKPPAPVPPVDGESFS